MMKRKTEFETGEIHENQSVRVDIISGRHCDHRHSRGDSISENRTHIARIVVPSETVPMLDNTTHLFGKGSGVGGYVCDALLSPIAARST